MMKKLGFEEIDSAILKEIDYGDDVFKGREGRGFSSREADISDARMRLKRANKLGFDTLCERFRKDGQFRYRMTSYMAAPSSRWSDTTFSLI